MEFFRMLQARKEVENGMEKGCVFCGIVNGQTTTEILYENNILVVFKDIKPHAPTHLLIVPKKHIRSVNDLSADELPILADMVAAAKEMAKRYSISESGYRLLVNVERGGGQVIFHLHMHLIGGWH
jgi:histidine triad (HIT) family protein